MSGINFRSLTDKDLAIISRKAGLDSGLTREEMVRKLRPIFKLVEKSRQEPIKTWQKGDILGVKGKEGTVYEVSKGGTKYAMKCFKSTKSENRLQREGDFLQRAAKIGVSPKVVEINPEEHYIVMDLLEENLFDVLKSTQGKLTEKIQKDMITIFKKLDKEGIMHGDPNPLNFMFKKGKLYIIDFGFASEIDEDLKKKVGKSPNVEMMSLGFILKVKDMCPPKNFPILLESISPERRKSVGL